MDRPRGRLEPTLRFGIARFSSGSATLSRQDLISETHRGVGFGPPWVDGVQVSAMVWVDGGPRGGFPWWVEFPMCFFLNGGDVKLLKLLGLMMMMMMMMMMMIRRFDLFFVFFEWGRCEKKTVDFSRTYTVIFLVDFIGNLGKYSSHTDSIGMI